MGQEGGEVVEVKEQDDGEEELLLILRQRGMEILERSNTHYSTTPPQRAPPQYSVPPAMPPPHTHTERDPPSPASPVYHTSNAPPSPLPSRSPECPPESPRILHTGPASRENNPAWPEIKEERRAREDRRTANETYCSKSCAKEPSISPKKLCNPSRDSKEMMRCASANEASGADSRPAEACAAEASASPSSRVSKEPYKRAQELGIFAKAPGIPQPPARSSNVSKEPYIHASNEPYIYASKDACGVSNGPCKPTILKRKTQADGRRKRRGADKVA